MQGVLFNTDPCLLQKLATCRGPVFIGLEVSPEKLAKVRVVGAPNTEETWRKQFELLEKGGEKNMGVGLGVPGG